MTRLLRWAFNSAAAVSGLLSVVTCVLWVRSYWWADYADRVSPRRTCGITSWRGRLIVEWGDSLVAVPAGRWEVAAADVAWYDPSLWASETGPSQFGHSRDVFAMGSGTVVIRRWWAPHWSLAAATWVFAAASVVPPRLRERRRAKAGLCPCCGYDLRATPDGRGPLLDRCPECGTTPGAKG
jgi:hypothetical protein